MTELLDRAVALASTFPADIQDEIARLVLAFADADEALVDLTPEEEAALDRSEAAAAAASSRATRRWRRSGRSMGCEGPRHCAIG